MKFSVGYQLSNRGQEPFPDVLLDFKERIAEVYFAWVGMASGRAALGIDRNGVVNHSLRKQLEKDLYRISKSGVGLNILFNANCYGGLALSTELESEVRSTINYLVDRIGGIRAVTTTSLAIAYIVKNHFPEIDVRASVNMRIGTVEGMQHVSGLFDSYVVQRDIQRYLAHMKILKEWCNNNGKTLHMLANSGCIRYCPGQTFDDNIVAHDQEIRGIPNIEGFRHHVCSHSYRKENGRHTALQATWIRPEDLHNYEGTVDAVKLATRIHPNPKKVIGAYATGHFNGNLLDLLEPSVGKFFEPHMINNRDFPKDWFKRTSTCGWKCDNCGYCEKIEKMVFQKML